MLRPARFSMFLLMVSGAARAEETMPLAAATPETPPSLTVCAKSADAAVPVATGQLAVGGAGPGDTKVFLAGQETPQLCRFGGLTSVFAAEALSRIDFLPGGFGVRYGRATGGVIDVETRPGRDDRTGGMFDVDLYDGAGMVEGPVGAGRYFAAARRSYVDAALPLVGGIVSP